MSIALLALPIGALIAAPHLLPRISIAPVAGIVMWIAVLCLRAVLSVFLAVALMLYLPSTVPFELIDRWCLHAALPFLTPHLRLSAHPFGDVASLLPALAVSVSAGSVAFGTWRAVRGVGRWLRSSAVGPGPSNSVVVSERELIVATAGVRQPRVIISAGALLNLDEEELDAGIQHEWGHVRRGHRPVTMASAGLLGCSRFLPGGRSAFRNLQFHLERDADEYAVRQTGNPAALASAICKVASGGGWTTSPALASLAGSDAVDRLRILLADLGASEGRDASAVSSALAVAAGIAALALLVAVPGLAHAGAEQLHLPVGAFSGCGA